MLSRRRFLQANLTCIAWSAPGLAATSGNEPLPAELESPAPASKRDYWNDWPRYLASKMNEARARRKAALAAIRSEAEAQERIRFVRAKVWELIGGPLDRTPLNPTIAGTIERDTYRVEKVIFESQPQVYVTAHLYVPKAGTPPFPGILAPLGHTREGKAYRNYQYLYQTLARNGYMVLTFDPFGQGERHQYLDARTGQSRYGPTGEHSQAGRPLLLLGATFAQYRVWDAVRALDYLLTRPEVDRARIGCTGHSGGGTITMYLCALEPRIQAAVEIEGNSENLAGPAYDPPGATADAEQNLVGSLAVGIDRGDLLWAFAPKPLLVCYTPLDTGTTYSPLYAEGTEEIFDELKRVYGLFGVPEKVQLLGSPLPHDLDFFNRRAACDWFNRWLEKGNLTANESEFDSSPPQSLNCTTSGQVLTSLRGRSVVRLNADRCRALATSSSSRSPVGGPSQREGVRGELRMLLALPAGRTPLQPRVLSSHNRKGVILQEIEFRSEPQVRLRGWFFRPSNGSSPFRTILYASGSSNGLVAEPEGIDALILRGFALCAMDLRGLGSGTPRYPSGGPAFYHGEHFEDGYAWASLALGQPVLGQRVWDFLRCLDYLETRSDVSLRQIVVHGVGGSGLVALLGTALDDRPRSILIERMIADLRSVLESEDYALPLPSIAFGVLRVLDIPDVVASLAPRPCWMQNAEDAQGGTLNLPKLLGAYQSAVERYKQEGAEDGLQFLVQPDQKWRDSLLRWPDRAHLFA